MEGLSLPARMYNLSWTFKDRCYFHVQQSGRQAMRKKKNTFRVKVIDWLKLEKET